MGPLRNPILYKLQQPLDYFLDLKRCVLSRPDFKAPRCFTGSTAIDFFLLQGPAGLRYRYLGTGTILRFANIPYSTSLLASLRLARSPLYAFRYLVLLCFN
jgi:hypothetical protein